MRIHRLIILIILFCAIPAVSQRQETSLELLLENEAARIPAKVGIYVKHLASGEEAAVRADDLFNSASTRKVPVMIMAIQQYEQGKLDLRERVTIQRSDFRGGTGVLQYYDPGDVLTLHDLLTEMIITSDNTASEIMIRKLGGPDVINKWLADQNSITRTTWGNIEGIRRMYRLFNPVYASATDEELTALEYLRTENPLFNEYQDLFKGPRQGLAQQITANADLFADAIRRRAADDRNYWTGTTSPRDMGKFLESIERGKAASLKGCLEMKHILLRQQLGARRIPHYLDLPVAHKTGDVAPGVANDVGLVYARSGPIVISFFTMGNTGPYADTEDQIGKISKDIVDYFDKRNRG
jgi:beta-lactamase class A